MTSDDRVAFLTFGSLATIHGLAQVAPRGKPYSDIREGFVQTVRGGQFDTILVCSESRAAPLDPLYSTRSGG